MKKDKLISLRMEHDLYQAYITKALKKGNKENRLVKLSEVIREILLKNV